MKEFLDIEDLSEYLSIKKSTLYAKVSSGQIPHYKIGHLVRFKKEEIDNWMEGLRKMVVDSATKTREIFDQLKNSKKIDIDNIIKKSIESTKCKDYNSIQRETRPESRRGG